MSIVIKEVRRPAPVYRDFYTGEVQSAQVHKFVETDGGRTTHLALAIITSQGRSVRALTACGHHFSERHDWVAGFGSDLAGRVDCPNCREAYLNVNPKEAL